MAVCERTMPTLQEYIAFTTNGFLTPPKAMGKFPNRICMAVRKPVYNCYPSQFFWARHSDCCSFTSSRINLSTLVVTTDQVFNEFSWRRCPIPPPIRDFVKMYYDKYGATGPSLLNICYCLAMLHLIIKTGLSNNTNLVPGL